MAIKIIYSLHFPMATNSFPLPSKLISIILIQWFPARKTLNNILFFLRNLHFEISLSPVFIEYTFCKLKTVISLLRIKLICNTNTDLLRVLEIDHGSTRYCTRTPWQIVSQDLLQFTSHNESDRQMAHRHTH